MVSKKGHKNKGVTSRKASRWIGHPVCVVLNNGSYYVGMVTGIDNDKLILSGTKGRGKMKPSVRSMGPVQVSGFLPSLFGGSGVFNPPAANAAGGFNPFGTNAAGAFNPFGAGAIGGGQPQAGFGWGSFFGKVKQMWPHVQFGLQMVKSIMPLMGAFKI